MNLERKKFNLGWYGKGIIIASLIMVALLLFAGALQKIGTSFFDFSEVEDAQMLLEDFGEVMESIGVMVRGTFVVFASVLIAKLIIEEYRKKTVTVMY